MCCLFCQVLTQSHAEAWDHVNIQAELNAWHHASMVYDNNRLRFYLDGVAEPEQANDSGELLVKDTPLVIGQAGPGTEKEFFVGLSTTVGLEPEITICSKISSLNYL